MLQFAAMLFWVEDALLPDAWASLPPVSVKQKEEEHTAGFW